MTDQHSEQGRRALKINGNQIRRGTLLLVEGGLWRVTKAEATKTGKSGAYNQVEMKNIQTGTKKNTRFRASETVERARLEEHDCTFLYMEGDDAVVMDAQTFDQFTLPAEVLGDDAIFLADGLQITVEFHEGAPISLNLPQHVLLSVAETEPAIKGQTASNSFKPAVLSNGMRTTVPHFVNEGDEIIVDTSERTYVKRAD